MEWSNLQDPICRIKRSSGPDRNPGSCTWWQSNGVSRSVSRSGSRCRRLDLERGVVLWIMAVYLQIIATDCRFSWSSIASLEKLSRENRLKCLEIVLESACHRSGVEHMGYIVLFLVPSSRMMGYIASQRASNIPNEYTPNIPQYASGKTQHHQKNNVWHLHTSGWSGKTIFGESINKNSDPHNRSAA